MHQKTSIEPSIKFRKINKLLKEQYGFRISRKMSLRQIDKMTEALNNEITHLKLKGESVRESAEISKRVLISEGLKELREFIETVEFYKSPKFDLVIGLLTDFVTHRVELGGDFDHAVTEAMTEYRSSPYLFDDDIVESKIREHASDIMSSALAQSADVTPNIGVEPSFGAEPELDMNLGLGESNMKNKIVKEEDSDVVSKFERILAKQRELKQGPGVVDPSVARHPEVKKDKWAGVTHRSSALGSHNPTVDADTESEADRILRRSGKLKNVGLVDNRFSEVKESANLIKRLRLLLESEVDEAEIIMSSKKISQDLQEMIEKIGRLQNEKLPLVTDQMRNVHGVEAAAEFQTKTYAVLKNVMDALYASTDQLNNMIQVMAGDMSIDMENPVNTLSGVDVDVDVDADPEGMNFSEFDVEEPEVDLDNLAPDDFGPDEVDLGRAQKESINHLKSKVARARTIVENLKKIKTAKK